MKKIVKGFLKNLGYEIRKAHTPIKREKPSLLKHDIQFLEDEKFNIEFTHVAFEGNHYFPPKYALHRPAVADLLQGTLYEPDTHEFVKHFFNSFTGSMIHAGTFFGDMIPNFSQAVPGNVYAFEPVFENYVLAKLCVDQNDLSNVILMNSALSDNLCNLYIDTNQGDGRHAGGASTVADKGAICTAIDIDRLDIEDIILIQLDVEGHELIALKGAQTTINKCRPVVAIEDNNNNCSDFLSDLKYENIGIIPGLAIWIPVENKKYRDNVLSFLN
jgi:FkbM family methyltransferase